MQHIAETPLSAASDNPHIAPGATVSEGHPAEVGLCLLPLALDGQQLPQPLLFSASLLCALGPCLGVPDAWQAAEISPKGLLAGM